MRRSDYDYFAHSERVASRPALLKEKRLRNQLEEPGYLSVYARLAKLMDQNEELELVSGSDPYDNN